MPTPFRPYCPDQVMLLPPDIKDWLPEDHLAHPVSELVETMDLSTFYAPYEGDGRRQSLSAPRMMLKILIYGYATGVFSSRGIARKLQEDVEFRVLAADNFPNHQTINEFRRRHLADFKRLFVAVVRIAQVVRRRLIQSEDERLGQDGRGQQLPQELRRRKDRLAGIRAAKARIEERAREADKARSREPGAERNPKGWETVPARLWGA